MNNRFGVEMFNNTLIALGIWVGIRQNLLAHLVLGDSQITALEAAVLDVCDGDFRHELLLLADQEPGDDVTDLRLLATWVFDRVSTLSKSQREASKVATAAGDGSSGAALSREEVDRINQMQLMSSLVLDAHTYREVDKKLTTDNDDLEQGYMARRNAHVQDVQAMQKEMQNMDVHIECETGAIGSRKFQYVRDAAVGAK